MTTRTKLKARGTALVLAGAIVGGGAIAGAITEPRIHICHATNSAANPYVMINVKVENLESERSAHAHKHVGPVGPTTDGSVWGDIIPEVGAFEGQNWSTGESSMAYAIWAEECNVDRAKIRMAKTSTTLAGPVTTTTAPATTTTAGPVAATTTTALAPTTTIMYETAPVPN